MSLYSRIHNWVTGEVLTASDLNTEFNNIITNSVSDSIAGTSSNVSAMQTTVSPGALGSESLASNVTGELQRLRYMVQQILGGAQWYIPPTRNLSNLLITGSDIPANSIAGSNLINGTLTGTQIADGSISNSKLQAASPQVSASSGSFLTFSTTYTDVTNLSVTITTIGRPVHLMVQGDGTATSQLLSSNNVGGEGSFQFIRGATPVVQYEYLAPSGNVILPSSILRHLDTPAAGTYTYKLQVKNNGGAFQSGIKNAVLVAYEI